MPGAKLSKIRFIPFVDAYHFAACFAFLCSFSANMNLYFIIPLQYT